MRDSTTPIDEAVRALDDQVRLGKVLYVGISDSPAWVVAQANTLADLRGWSPFVALQIPYSARAAIPERELLPMAAAFGLAVVPWGVLGAGVLTGKPAEERRWPEDRVSERAERVLEALPEVGGRARVHAGTGRDRLGRQRPSPPTVVPLVAATREEQMVENLAAADISSSQTRSTRSTRPASRSSAFRATSSSRRMSESSSTATRTTASGAAEASVVRGETPSTLRRRSSAGRALHS